VAVVIENPVLNSPFAEPKKHFRFDEDGITDEIVEERRISTYFIPIAQPKKKGPQTALPADWTSERVRENEFINQVRGDVNAWRLAGRPGVTPVTRELLEYWTNPDRERRLFFCQIEALETAIYLAEVAPNTGRAWIERQIKLANDEANPGLYRVAVKMATGSGKTVVMAMLIAWQTLNKLANTQDKRFSDTFLIVTPGITIRDRLQVLLPNGPGNYYRLMDLVPPGLYERMQAATVLITNFHAFLPRVREEFRGVAATTKKILAKDGDVNRFNESPDQMIRRVCRDLGSKKNIVVINDEAHHCYREKAQTAAAKMSLDERAEVKQNAEAARVWISGLEAVAKKIGIRTVYDLSATPFFLRGSGYSEGTLFPWVVSDFSLIDAIESGIVKIPRVPVSDDQMTGDLPTYRNLWLRIRDHLPKKGRGATAPTGATPLPKELEAALHSLYGNYEKAYKKWEAAAIPDSTPPVFIVVCSNTTVSKLVYDWISGWEKELPDGTKVIQAGNLEIFNNEDHGQWRPRPNTLLIDSAQLESGEAMSADFKKLVVEEIEEFKDEYRQRHKGANLDDITDEQILREVMNTVGKPGKLGEHVKCVVSVSMLTEGWDASTVTHILGVRAFGTQLLCEQVVGRGLRRTSYEPNEDGLLEPDYAEVYGVPFSFIPTAGTAAEPKPPKPVHHVKAMADRANLEITYPRVIGYRYELPSDSLTANFTEASKKVLSSREIPINVQMNPIVGETEVHTLDDIKKRRMQEVAFKIAQLLVQNYLKADEETTRPWLFPQALAITKEWLDGYVVCKDDAFPQLLLLTQLAHDAAATIHNAILLGSRGEKRLLPTLRPYDPVGSTSEVEFDTTKKVWTTDPERSHLNYVPLDSDWEAKLAETLESMDEVVCYVKNQSLGFAIPYTVEGRQANYLPDYIVRARDGGDDLLNLVIEVTGERKKEKAAKVEAAQNQWVPAVNNHGGFGRWAFLEVQDPWDAKNLIRASLPALAG
jgi:type III restriction enzyme